MRLDPSHDLEADLYEITLKETSDAGYKQYELSNFAMEGNESRHNLHYWKGDDYIGLGPGAVSRITTTEKCVFEFDFFCS